MKSHGLMRRVIAGMGANSFGVAITIGTQLASLPLFLSKWDTATYGVWLMLSALPGYLSMADVGMVTAAGNRMNMAISAGDPAEANHVFHSVQVFVTTVCALIAVMVIPLIWWFPWPVETNSDQRLAVIALSAGVLVSFFGGLTEQVFKSTQRYATGILLGNLTRLAEWFGGIAGLLLVGTFSAVAAGGLLMRVVFTLLSMRLASESSRGLSWGIRSASTKKVRELIQPAAAFMAFPLANALSFQGVTLLVGGLLGPVAVAMFNTYRTLARTAVQFTSLFSYALWPEFSRLFGIGSRDELRNLAVRSSWLGAAQALFISAALFILAPWILKLWTHDQISFDPVVFGVLMLYAAVCGIWNVPKVLLMATNRHGSLAIWSLVVGILCVGLVLALGSPLALIGVSGAMLISEVFIALVCARLAWQVFGPSAHQQAVSF